MILRAGIGGVDGRTVVRADDLQVEAPVTWQEQINVVVLKRARKRIGCAR